MNSFRIPARASAWFCVLLTLIVVPASAAELKTRNVILIMSDGVRWQEVFTGAEAKLMTAANGGVKDEADLRQKFWRATPEARRSALMPFTWSVITKQGQLWGNQQKGSVVRVANGHNFSYPGYNEAFSGIPDPRIDSNDKVNNPNITVFEWLHQKPGYRGRVGAFGTWDVFPWILNRERAGFHIVGGFEPVGPGTTPRQKLLNDLIHDTTRIIDVITLDAYHYHGSMDFFLETKPRAMFIGYGETDEWAHAGRYDLYLEALRNVDKFIQRLWETVQSLPDYRDKTTLLITTDHGRGDAPVGWKSHGKDTKGSEHIWMAFLGPDTPGLGERSKTPVATQSQVAATLAAFLGEDFRAAIPKAAPAIKEVLRQ